MESDPLNEIVDKAINEQMKTQKEEHANNLLRMTNYKSICLYPQKPAPEKVGYADFDSRPISENSVAEEALLNRSQDGRIRVNETRQWPHSVHGLLSMKFDELLYTGTATMIGPNIAITAANNLYNFETKTEASDVHLYPAANDHLLPFGAVKVQAFYYPEEYKATKKEDYALLILEHNIGEQTGYFGLHAIERPDIEGKMINITGYPGDKVADKPKHHQMWGMEGPIGHLDDDLMSYQIDTYAGQSGSGIWYNTGCEYSIIGVHVLSSGMYNQGTFLNKKRVERIREWILQFYLKQEHPQLIKSLHLGKKNIEDKGAEYLSKANFPQLQRLNLPNNQMGDKGVEHLSKANFPQLQSLDLSYNEIGEKGAEYLSKANFPQLQSLYLYNNQIGEKGAEHLSKANFPQLQTLYLSDNQIGDKGAEYVSRANFPQLQSLYLFNNQIGEKGAEYLSKANFPKLQSLDLSSNQIRDNGAEYMSKANFPQLQLLYLSHNQIGEKGAQFLLVMKSHHPNTIRLSISY